MNDTSNFGFPAAAQQLGVSLRVLRHAIRTGKIAAPAQNTATARLTGAWLAEASKAVAEQPLSRALKAQKAAPSRITRAPPAGANIRTAYAIIMPIRPRKPRKIKTPAPAGVFHSARAQHEGGGADLETAILADGQMGFHIFGRVLLQMAYGGHQLGRGFCPRGPIGEIQMQAAE